MCRLWYTCHLVAGSDHSAINLNVRPSFLMFSWDASSIAWQSQDSILVKRETQIDCPCLHP